MPEVLVLHSGWRDYNDAIADALYLDHNAAMTVVCWSDASTRHRRWLDDSRSDLLRRSAVSDRQLADLTRSRPWNCVVVSGRMDNGYLKACEIAKRLRIPVVGGSDEFFLGTTRQRIKIILRRLLYGRYFDFMWVPGPRHVLWAEMLGYRGRVIEHLLAGDTALFGTAIAEPLSWAERKDILFIGRPHPSKGVDTLVEAFNTSRSLRDSGARLLLVGGSPDAFGVHDCERIVCVPHVSQRELCRWVRGARVFVLPSRYEPWGVVVHEMSAAGLPLVLSDSVGSADQFLRDGVNGRGFRSGDAQALRSALEDMINVDPVAISLMASESRRLAGNHSPALCASALMTAVVHARVPHD